MVNVCIDITKQKLSIMKNKKIWIGVAALSMLVFSACNKYDDGPGVSLRSRKERISNEWRVDKAYNGSDDVSSDFDQYNITLRKDNSTTLEATYSFLSVDYSYSTNGTWSFLDNDTKVRVDYENNDADNTYVILKLEEDRLWVREEGSDLVLHLVPR
jgi:hypothetical protein